MAAKFVSKALKEFLLGKNIVLLIPQNSANSKYGKKFLRKVAVIVSIG
jgi:hypothetical protein